MGARIVIDKATLKSHSACIVYLKSPEWDEGEQALVYSDWDATVARLSAEGRPGLDRLGWLVAHKLVPMTAEEFATIKKAHGGPQ